MAGAQTQSMTQSAMSKSRESTACVSFASASSVVEREGASWSEVTQVDDEHYRLRLGGPLRPFWMAALGRGLSEHQISIVRAHAKRGHEARWVTELTLRPLEGAKDPCSLSYIRLVNAAQPQTAPRDTLRVARYTLEETPDHGGTLRLAFESEDSLGLLGEMLSSLAALMLFPIEMHIETRDGRAHDCLWLCGVGASRPEPFAVRWLQRLLQEG